MTIVSADQLDSLYRRFAAHHGADEDEAALLAAALLRADLRGHTTQGIALLPYVDELLREGEMTFGRPLETARETPATALLDANRGVGQVIGMRAMALAIEKARTAGIGYVAVRNSSDYAMASAYVLPAVDAGLIGISMSTGPILVAPWGGRDGWFCTNPLALGVPAGRRDPVVIDMATSAYSMGAVVRAARDGLRLDTPGVVGTDGRYSDDPSSVILDVMARESRMTGALLPAGPKGFGWVLLVEMLSALLSGERTWEDERPSDSEQRPAYYGQAFIAIDIAAFQDPEAFAASADRMIETLTSSRPAEGFEAVRVHGGGAAEAERRAREEGVPLRDEEWQMVEQLAARLGLATT